jgi:hypothetical protein
MWLWSQAFRTCIVALTASALSLAQVQLPDGTKIACRLDQTISSATAEEGQSVQLVATENIKIGDTIVIPQGAVNITSEAEGAEVEMNGAFVGSAPSTQRLTPGSHRIVVRNGRQVWERTLQVQPGASVTVHARFGT